MQSFYFLRYPLRIQVYQSNLPKAVVLFMHLLANEYCLKREIQVSVALGKIGYSFKVSILEFRETVIHVSSI